MLPTILSSALPATVVSSIEAAASWEAISPYFTASPVSVSTGYNFDFEIWLEDSLFGLVDAREAARALIGLETNDCDLHLTEVYEVKNIIAHDVRLISDGTRYVELSVDAGVSGEVCADWQQYQRDHEVRQLLDEGREYPAPYACTGFSGPISLKLALVVEGNEIEKSNLELISIGDNSITKKCR